MSIVKKLVDQMEGTVALSSRIGKGSVVQITLPLKADETKQCELPASPRSRS